MTNAVDTTAGLLKGAISASFPKLTLKNCIKDDGAIVKNV